jgi:prophage regulatory protein
MANKPHQTTLGGLPAEGYVRLPQVLRAYPVSRSTWFAGIKSGRFPKPVKLGPRTTAWRVSDLRALIEAPPPVDSAKLPTKKAKPTAADLAGQA